MAKKHFQRALSVGLSLALCAGMVAPGFAATFGELQGAIDSGMSYWKDEEKTQYRIETTTDEEGKRNIKLYEDVEAEKGEKGIVIGNRSGDEKSKDIVLDLNGHNIDLNPDAVLKVEDGKFYQATKDENGNKTATEDKATSLNNGSVISIKKDAALTLKDSSATGSAEDGTYQSGVITGGNVAYGGGIYNAGTFRMGSGAISGNKGSNSGGGLALAKDAQLTIMDGGAISGNWSYYNGGGVYMDSYATGRDETNKFTMNGGAISGNVSKNGGGVYTNSFFDMTGGIISGNTASSGGGVNLWSSHTVFNMTGGTISDNTAVWSGGGVDNAGTFNMTSGTISGNHAAKNGGGVYNHPRWGGQVTFTVTNGVVLGNTADGEGNYVYNSNPTYYNDPIVTYKGTCVVEDNDGSVTVTTRDADDNVTSTRTITLPKDGDGKTVVPAVTEEGTAILPEKTAIGDSTYVNGATIDKDGNIISTTVGDKDENGNVTVTTKTEKPDGTEEDVTTTVTAPEGKEDEVKTNPDSTTTVPAGSTVTDKDGKEYELPEGGTIDKDGIVRDKDGNPVAPKKGNTNAGGGTGGTGSTDVVVIDGVEVPLAGLVSVEDVLDVLYRLAEGVDGERDEVVAWAVENGIIDDETDVEELVTVAALRAILANYARAFELDVDVTTLATLTGEDDDIVMNCDEVIDEFFTKAEEDEAA